MGILRRVVLNTVKRVHNSYGPSLSNRWLRDKIGHNAHSEAEDAGKVLHSLHALAPLPRADAHEQNTSTGEDASSELKSNGLKQSL